MEIMHTDKAPAAVGPYSQAVKTGNLLFCSGQIGLNPATGEMVGTTVAEQAKQVMENVKALLENDRQSRLSLTSLLFLKKLDQALTTL